MSELLIIAMFFLKDFYLKNKEFPKAINFFIKGLVILGFYEFGFILIFSLMGRVVELDFSDEFWTFFCMDRLFVYGVCFDCGYLHCPFCNKRGQGVFVE